MNRFDVSEPAGRHPTTTLEIKKPFSHAPWKRFMCIAGVGSASFGLLLIAVGTAVADCPRTDPDGRSLAHRFLSRMSGGEASVRKGMERLRLRKPSLSQYKEARPVDPAFLAPSAKSTPPECKHPIPKHPQTRQVSWYRVVVEVALNDRLEPLSGLGHGIVHALAELLLNLSQLSSHALADRGAPHHESP
jgi:hypothetical protein